MPVPGVGICGGQRSDERARRPVLLDTGRGQRDGGGWVVLHHHFAAAGDRVGHVGQRLVAGPGATTQLVDEAGPVASVDDVGAGAAGDHIVTAPAYDPVVAAQTEQPVASTRPDQDVVA